MMGWRCPLTVTGLTQASPDAQKAFIDWLDSMKKRGILHLRSK